MECFRGLTLNMEKEIVGGVFWCIFIFMIRHTEEGIQAAQIEWSVAQGPVYISRAGLGRHPAPRSAYRDVYPR